MDVKKGLEKEWKIASNTHARTVCVDDYDRDGDGGSGGSCNDLVNSPANLLSLRCFWQLVSLQWDTH